MELLKLKPLTNEYLESIGFVWHTDSDESSYVANEMAVLSESEAEAYYEAGNELYDMFVEAGEYVIKNNLFYELGIPEKLVDVIKKSWEEDAHWHIYGRFDLAGGIDGRPIKLIEFNADTPTAVFESAIVQWAMLKYNNLNEESQFNSLYESLKENFKRLLTLEASTADFEELNQNTGFKILFSSIEGSSEDENTTRLLEYIATEAGFDCDFEFVNYVNFSEDGYFKEDEHFEYWFKLIPWEMIANEEPELLDVLIKIIKNDKGVVLNPPYTLLFQSKGMLKILWDLFPNHPLLLETSFSPLQGKKQIKKVFFGREGANVSIIGSDGEVLMENGGKYGDQPSIYQEFVEFPRDDSKRCYQAGLFYAFESCALGFRRGGEILNNTSKFVGHIIKN